MNHVTRLPHVAIAICAAIFAAPAPGLDLFGGFAHCDCVSPEGCPCGTQEQLAPVLQSALPLQLAAQVNTSPWAPWIVQDQACSASVPTRGCSAAQVDI